MSELSNTTGTTTAQPLASAQPAMQPPAENPLEQLRDIHLPEQIDQFPYAPGWWILLALILIAIGYYLFRVYRYRRAIRLLKPAKFEISQLRSLKSDELSAHSIAKLSALLKRVCLLYFPRKTVASLSGKSWLDFLNQQAAKRQLNTVFFSGDDVELFAAASYQAKPTIAQTDWHRLLQSSENCIESIIRSAAKNNPKHLIGGKSK